MRKSRDPEPGSPQPAADDMQKIAGIGAPDFLQGVEKRLRRKRLHQSFGLGRGENQVAFLPRRKPIKEFQLFLKRKIEKLTLPIRCHLRETKDTLTVSTLAIGVARGFRKFSLIQYLLSANSFTTPIKVSNLQFAS